MKSRSFVFFRGSFDYQEEDEKSIHGLDNIGWLIEVH